MAIVCQKLWLPLSPALSIHQTRQALFSLISLPGLSPAAAASPLPNSFQTHLYLLPATPCHPPPAGWTTKRGGNPPTARGNFSHHTNDGKDLFPGGIHSFLSLPPFLSLWDMNQADTIMFKSLCSHRTTVRPPSSTDEDDTLSQCHSRGKGASHLVLGLGRGLPGKAPSSPSAGC